MKKISLIAVLVLCGCVHREAYDPPYTFDTAAYAKSQGWCGKLVKSPGVYYDENCVAKVR